MADVGVNFQVAGEQDIKRALKDITQQSKTLSAEMSAVTSAFDKNTTAEEKAAAKKDVLSRQIQVQQTRIEALTELVNRSAESTGEDSQQTQRLQEQLYKAQAALNKMNGELEEADSSLDDTADGMQDVADSTGEAAQQGSIFGDVFKAEVISQAVISGVKNLAAAMASVASGIKECFTESVAWADELLTLSTNTNIGTAQLQAYQYMAGLVDTDINTITSSQRKLLQTMKTASSGTGTAAARFEQLNVSVTNADGTLRDTNSVFLDVIDALGTIESQTDRDAIAMDLFGKSAQELNSLIAVGSDGINEYASEAERLGYILDDSMLSRLGDVADAQDRITAAWDSIKRNGSAAFAPAITAIADEFMPVVQNATSELNALFNGDLSLDALCKNIASEFESNKTSIAKALSDGINGAFESATTIINNLPAIINTAADIVSSLCESIKGAEQGRALGQALGNLIDAAGDFIAETSGPVTELVTQFVGAMVAELSNPLYGGKLAWALIKGIASGIGTFISGIDDAMSHLFDTALTDAQIKTLVDKGYSVETIASQYGMSVDSINEALDRVNATVEATTTTLEDGAEAIDKAAETIDNSVETVKQGIEDNLSEFPSETWGADLIAGMAAGIQSQYGTLDSAVAGAAEIINGQLHFSRPDYGVLRNYEQWMPDFMSGLAAGIDENSYKVSDAIGRVAGSIEAGITGGISGAAGGTVVNLTVTDPSEAWTEYLFDKFNVRLGGVLA